MLVKMFIPLTQALFKFVFFSAMSYFYLTSLISTKHLFFFLRSNLGNKKKLSGQCGDGAKGIGQKLANIQRRKFVVEKTVPQIRALFRTNILGTLSSL